MAWCKGNDVLHLHYHGGSKSSRRGFLLFYGLNTGALQRAVLTGEGDWRDKSIVTSLGWHPIQMLVPKPLYLIRIIQNDQVDDFTILYVYACVCVCAHTCLVSPGVGNIYLQKTKTDVHAGNTLQEVCAMLPHHLTECLTPLLWAFVIRSAVFPGWFHVVYVFSASSLCSLLVRHWRSNVEHVSSKFSQYGIWALTTCDCAKCTVIQLSKNRITLIPSILQNKAVLGICISIMSPRMFLKTCKTFIG